MIDQMPCVFHRRPTCSHCHGAGFVHVHQRRSRPLWWTAGRLWLDGQAWWVGRACRPARRSTSSSPESDNERSTRHRLLAIRLLLAAGVLGTLFLVTVQHLSRAEGAASAGVSPFLDVVLASWLISVASLVLLAAVLLESCRAIADAS